MNPTRFPGGITNAGVTENLRNLGTVDSSKFITFWEDFIAAPAALGTFTAISGNGGLATVATTEEVDTPQTSFVLDDAKRFFFKTKLSIAATAQAAIAGFADDLAAVTAGVSISLDAGNLILSVVGTGTTTETVAVTYANAEQVTFGFEYVPNEGVFGYFNDTCVVAIRDMTNLDTSTALLAGVYSDGSTLTIDYVFAAVER